MRISTGANAWRKIEGVMGDRRISREREGNVLVWYASYMNALETMVLTEKQQEKVQIGKKYLVRIIAGIKRAVGVKERSKKKLARSTWAGHVEKMADEKLAKRADAQKVERKWRRGRPKLRR